MMSSYTGWFSLSVGASPPHLVLYTFGAMIEIAVLAQLFLASFLFWPNPWHIYEADSLSTILNLP